MKNNFDSKPVAEIRDGEKRLKKIQSFVSQAFESDMLDFHYDRNSASLIIKVPNVSNARELHADLTALIVSNAV
jgi:hypothetical protein